MLFQGSWITIQLINNHPDSAITAHLTMLFGTPPKLNPIQCIPAFLELIPFVSKDTVRWLQSFVYSEIEILGLERLKEFSKRGKGYQYIQGTKPMTLGAGFYDNPVGILAWIGRSKRFHYHFVAFLTSKHLPWFPVPTMIYRREISRLV